jgi:II/X family phage/plasmid replication protein
VIDWVSFVAPCRHAKRVNGGLVASIRPDGSVEWQTYKRVSVRGSHDASVTVRTHDGSCEHIEVSGNPVKWFQGHNLWGTDDLPALVLSMIEALVQRDDLGLTPTDEDRAIWRGGGVRLTRVDVTESFHLPSRGDVLAWLRAAEQTAHLSHRGRGQLVKGSTLYFGKHSRRWSLKLYAKGQELDAKGHRQLVVDQLPAVREWAERSLRAELTLRSMELKRRELDSLGAWQRFDVDSSEVPAQLLRPVLGSMTMTTTTTLPASVLESLRPTLRAAFAAWEAGHDLRSMFPRPTFYKFRKELLAHGIDIATVQQQEGSNVVPMIRFLEAVPAGIPEWAIGTPLYFEPRRLRVA